MAHRTRKRDEFKMQQDHLTTEKLAERVLQDMEKMSPVQKAEVRRHLERAFPQQANLSSLAGRSQHLHGLARAAELIESEEKCFHEVWDFFENLKSEHVKYKM